MASTTTPCLHNAVKTVVEILVQVQRSRKKDDTAISSDVETMSGANEEITLSAGEVSAGE